MFVSSKWLARRPTRHFRGGYELIFFFLSVRFLLYIVVRILAEPRGICQMNFSSFFLTSDLFFPRFFEAWGMGTGVCAMGAYDGQALTARISLFSF